MSYLFSKANHYRLIEGFFDSKKDFIVLGLCGKTGSGSTTVANILQKSFEQLNLPVPADNLSNSIEDHEYRLLYTYAKVHWRPFYRIKTSALITAHVLNESMDLFLKFLYEFLLTSQEQRLQEALIGIVKEFFTSEMCFNLNEWIQLDPKNGVSVSEWLKSDQYPTQKDGDETKPVKFTLRNHKDSITVVDAQLSDTREKCILTLQKSLDRQDGQNSDSLSVEFYYTEKDGCALYYFKAKDLYSLFLEYQQRRQQKKGFDNPLLFFLLQQFIYDYLPNACAQLWDELAKYIPDVKVAALQKLGNHLRISGKPYNTDFSREAYATIVVDINTAIKLLNASLAWQKSWAETDDLQKQVKRSLVVVDCIKNPFESMYLKDRYTSYYLIGIYTEDRIRRERLRRDQHLADSHIQAIDIIEQTKEFKRQYKEVLKSTQIIREWLLRDDIKQNMKELMEKWKESCTEEAKDLGLKWTKFNSLQLIFPQDCHCMLEDIKRVRDGVAAATKNNKKEGAIQVEAWEGSCHSLLKKMTLVLDELPRSIHHSPVVIDTIRTIYNRDLLNELPFILQNVGSCLENADIFINNETDSRQHHQLKQKLIRYVSLIMNPGLVLPSPVERCMQLAYTAKLNSGCISRQVGAVITDADYHLLSVGWNQQPEGQVPCSYRDLCSLYYHWSPEAYSDYECDDQDQIQERIKDPVTKLLDTPDCPLTLQGKLPAYCFKDIYNSIMGNDNQVHPRSLHAEETAFLNLGQYSAQGGILFTTSSPCELCAKKAKYKGIAKIYYIEPYSGISLKHVLNIGPNASRPQMLLFTGAIGRAYMQLYTPLLPKKDELAFWLGATVDVDLLNQIQKKEVQRVEETLSTEEKENCNE